MWEDKAAVPLQPDEAKILGDRIKVGRGDAIPLQMESLSERVPLRKWGLFPVSDDDVIQNAESEMDNDRRYVDNFLRIQKPKILASFTKQINETLLDFFYHCGSEPWTRISLQENPNSIVIARDFLKYLREKSDEFCTHVEDAFQNYYFPHGKQKTDLIAQQLLEIESIKKKMLADSRNNRDEQEKYLNLCDKLLLYQVWQSYVKSIIDISREMQEYLHYLWRMIGDDAEGWIHSLKNYAAEMQRKYLESISRRTQFTRLQLRQYLPEPGGKAEEKLFEELADPYIADLMGQMAWTLAIGEASHNPEEKVTIVLNSPRVEGFHYPKPTRHVIDKATAERVAVGIYNPYEHVAFAKQKLEPDLKNTSLWKIMELDFRFDWLENHGKEFDRLPLQEAHNERKNYVQEKVDKLVSLNAPLLNLSQTPFHPEGIYISHFQQLADDDQLPQQGEEFRQAGGELAHLLFTELRRRTPTLGSTHVLRHPGLSHELRVATAYLGLSLQNWQYYFNAQDRYLEYHRNPALPLLNLYLPEQNALTVRKLIRKYLDHSFHDLLHPEVTSLLTDLKIFTRLSLCYLMEVLPTRRAGLELTAPTEYYLSHETGDIPLAAQDDLEGLFHKVCRPVYLTSTGSAVANELVQRKIMELWRQTEEKGKSKLDIFLKNIEDKAQKLPTPTGRDWYPHLALAMKAVALDYVAQVRGTHGLGPSS